MDVLNDYKTPLKLAGKFANLVRGTDADSVNVNIAKVRSQITEIDNESLDVVMPLEMLGDTLLGINQMREMVENLRDFTRLDRSKTAEFDINKGLHNVI